MKEYLYICNYKQNKNNMTEDKFKLIGAGDVIILKSPAKAKHSINPAKDPRTNWYAGVDRLSEDDKKNKKFWVEPSTKIVLTDGHVFDLNNEIDAMNWKWVRYCKAVAASFTDFNQSPDAMFYVHIEGREAREKNTASEIKFQAARFIMEDESKNYCNRALLLGMDMEGESIEVVKEFLLAQANDKPEDVIRIYTSKHLAIHLLYLTAKKKGLILESNGVLRYGSHILGVDEESAIAFLQEKDSKGLVELLERAANPEYFEEADFKKKAEVTSEVEAEETEEPRKPGFQKKK